MMYRLKEKCPRKFLYQISGDKNTFLNLLYFVKNTKRKHNVKTGSKLHKKYVESLSRLDDFYKWCDDNEVDPMNFIRHKDNYKLTTENIFHCKVDINSFGLHWKHLIEENVNILVTDDVYNFNLKDGILSYTYLNKDFLYEYKSGSNVNHINFIEDDRKTEFKFKDYLSLNFYDFPINLEKELYNENNKNLYNFRLSTENGMASQVYDDFYYFLDKNKVECPKCKKLVDNAFEDYMIQFYKHDGC